MNTFLFTDIEGSTGKWQQFPEAMKHALAYHDTILEQEILRFSGRLLKHTGDGCMAVFTGRQALACALSIQIRMLSTDWSEVDGLAVRIGIDTGEDQEERGDFFGPAVNRTARIMSAGWSGQILLGSRAASELDVPRGASLADMGVHVLKDLQVPQQLFSLQHPDIQNSFPPPRTITAHPGNLPLQTTPFIGRKDELRQLGDLLRDPDTRLITILGRGGLGKTRTAIQAASENVDLFRHGTWFISLEESDGLGSILSVIAESLSLKFHGSQSEMQQLKNFITDREILLILDNFEHLQQNAALVSEILSSGPGVMALVTSRHRLGMKEETVFDLSGLTTEESDAYELFTCTAGRTLPGFIPGKKDMDAISESCRLLGGHPLAIELAASWIRTISCSEILDELSSGTDILESQGADRPERQQSMRSVFLYSWKLLEESEKAALAGLSCFEGGFTRKAALEVAGCSLRTLRNLCDRSLVAKAGEDRYALHRITRSFTAEKQNLIPGLAEKHTSYYGNLLRELKPRLTSDEQGKMLDFISLEYHNIRSAALNVYRSSNYDLMHIFSLSISVFLQLRSRFTEGLEFFTELISIVEKTDPSGNTHLLKLRETRARLLERLASFMLMSGLRKEAAHALSVAVELSSFFEDPAFQVLCYAGLGNISYMNSDYQSAEKYWRQALESANSSSELNRMSLLCNLANIGKKTGDFTGALDLLDQAEMELAKTEDIYAKAAFFSTRGDVCLKSGDVKTAELSFRKALELNRLTGNPRGTSYCLESLAGIICENSPENALLLAEEAVQLAQDTGLESRLKSSRKMLESISRSLISR